MFRGRGYTNFIETFRRTYLTFTNPQWTEQRQIMRWPQYPRIVILDSNNPLLDNLIKRQFKGYATVNAKEVLHLPKDDISQALAEKLQEASIKTEGALLYGYPATSDEALELDLLLDGVNMAIHYKISDSLQEKIEGDYHSCQKCGQVFNHSLHFITQTQPGFETTCSNSDQCHLEPVKVENSSRATQDVLNYYAEKGLLFELEINEGYAHLRSEDFHTNVQLQLQSQIKL